LIEADYRWEDMLKSNEEFRSRQSRDVPDQVADGVAGQNILVDLRISELLDTAAKLFDRAFRNPAAMAEEGAKLVQELQKVANGNSTWAPPRNDKRFNDSAWTENTFYKSLLQGYMAWSQSLQNFTEKAGLEAKEAATARCSVHISNRGVLAKKQDEAFTTTILSKAHSGMGRILGSRNEGNRASLTGAPPEFLVDYTLQPYNFARI
jgi:Poly-beta-hydroxybutyrate polymerase (PhaC) N-terminus